MRVSELRDKTSEIRKWFVDTIYLILALMQTVIEKKLIEYGNRANSIYQGVTQYL